MLIRHNLIIHVLRLMSLNVVSFAMPKTQQNQQLWFVKINSANIKELTKRMESVPSEFPVSPHPMSNGTNIYVPPIVYLKDLVNRTDTKLLDIINHTINNSKLENSKKQETVNIDKNTNISTSKPQPIYEISTDLSMSQSLINNNEAIIHNENTLNRYMNKINYRNNTLSEPTKMLENTESYIKLENNESNIVPLVLTLILCIVVSLYASLVVWRRILEKRYENCEMLLQDEYLESNDGYYI